MKRSLDSQRRTVGNAMNVARADHLGSRSVSHVKNSTAAGDRKFNQFEVAVRSPMEANSANVKAMTEEEMSNLRR
jgi:hypothetical protein